MITFKFELEKQETYYFEIKEKLKTQFYQNLKFYVLPFMPEKFRSRVVFLPEEFNPTKIYTKHRIEIQHLEEKLETEKKKFVKNLLLYFSEINSVDILISPSLYGSMGTFEIEKNKVIVRPRYDRGIISLQKLIINALTGYYNPDISWKEAQDKSTIIQNVFFPTKKSLFKILDTEFAGKLAEESAKYLEKLKVRSKQTIVKPENLTRSENIVFNLLMRNKNKIVTFDEIATWLWEDKSEEKYSEYAITKLMERLKRKSQKNLIQSQRGVGYILHV